MFFLLFFLTAGCPAPLDTSSVPVDTGEPGSHVPDDLGSCFFDFTCPYATSIGHRGAMRLAPENTLAAFEAAYAYGLDGVETDARSTADGVLVCMHDDDVARTTNGTGSVSDMTLAEVQALTVPSTFDDIPDQVVPTFLEALQYIATTDMVVDVDVKSDDAEALMADIREAGMTHRIFLNTGSTTEAAAFRAADPDVAIMPAIGDISELDPYLEWDPDLVEIEINDAEESVGPVAAAGARLFTDSLGFEAGRVVNGDVDVLYGSLLDEGVQVIQTDYPEYLVPFLATRNEETAGGTMGR